MLPAMGDLFAELARRASSSARREVDAYAREIPEFGILDTDPRARAETMEYAVWLRHRTSELAPTGAELTPTDLAAIAAMGESRANTGLSLDARQRVLRLHTELMLREVNEATDAQGDGDAGELVRLLGWFAAQGERGIAAYCQGFVSALRRRLPYVEQVALLVRALLAGDAMADELASAVGMEIPACCAVTVIRVPPPAGPGTERDRAPEAEIEALLKQYQVPLMWSPPTASTPGELIALTPLNPAPTPGAPTQPPEAPQPPKAPQPPGVPQPPEVLDLIKDFTRSLATPCAAGTTTADLPGLATALDRARRISRAAPLRRSPAHPHTTADVFVELALPEPEEAFGLRLHRVDDRAVRCSGVAVDPDPGHREPASFVDAKRERGVPRDERRLRVDRREIVAAVGVKRVDLGHHPRRYVPLRGCREEGGDARVDRARDPARLTLTT